jgi:hypothetical protein
MPLNYHNIVFILIGLSICINKEQYKLWSSEKINNGGVEEISYCEAEDLLVELPVIWHAAVIFARYFKISFISCILNHRENQAVIPSIVKLCIRFCDIFISLTFNPSSTSARTSLWPVSTYIATKRSRGVTQLLHHTEGVPWGKQE